MSHPISDAWFHRVKAATRDLIKAVGGLARAAEIASVSDSTLSRCQKSEHPDIISIPAVLALEAECGLHYVTCAMAEVHGRRLSDPSADGGKVINAIAAYSELMRSKSDLMAKMAAALEDGVITPTEADMLARSAGEVAAGLGRLQGMLAEVRAGDGDAGNVAPFHSRKS